MDKITAANQGENHKHIERICPQMALQVLLHPHSNETNQKFQMKHLNVVYEIGGPTVGSQADKRSRPYIKCLIIKCAFVQHKLKYNASIIILKIIPWFGYFDELLTPFCPIIGLLLCSFLLSHNSAQNSSQQDTSGRHLSVGYKKNPCQPLCNLLHKKVCFRYFFWRKNFWHSLFSLTQH